MYRRNQRLLIGLLVAVSFITAIAPRWALSHRGLPYEYHWDEPAILNRAITIAKTGDLNPHFFNYGSLSIYLSVAAVSATYLHSNTLPEDHPDAIASLKELKTGQGTHPWFISHPRFLLTSRWITVFFGVASCMALLGLGFIFRRPGMGAVAALLLGSSKFHAQNSAFLAVDVPASTCALFALAVGAIALHQRRTTVAPWLLAGALCGFATSFKYNMAGMAAVLVAGILLSQLPSSKKALAAAGFVGSLLLAFFVGTPYALLDLPAFLNDAGFEIRHYAVSGHANADIVPGFPHFLLHARRLAEDFGVLATALAALGLPLLLRKIRGSWVLVAGALLQWMLTASTTVSFHRNVLLVYPVFALCAGAGAVWLTKKLRPSDSRRGLAIFLVLSTLLVVPRLVAIRAGFDEGQRPDSRSEMVTQLNAMDSSPEAKVHLAQELLVHPRDLARLDRPFVIAPTQDLLCSRLPPEAIRVLPLKLASIYEKDRARIASNNRVLRKLEPLGIGSIGKRQTNLHIFSHRPKVGAWAGSAPLAPDPFCIENSALKLSLGETAIAPNATPFTLTAGEILSGQQQNLAPGNYQLKWCHRSTGASASSVILKIVGEGLEVERTMRAPTGFCRRTSHRFSVQSKGAVRFTFETQDDSEPILLSPPKLVGG